jgi:microsomal dipeptidase-like Zn-dependent dipeptidase
MGVRAKQAATGLPPGAIATVVLAALAWACVASAPPAGASSEPPKLTRYSLAGGCYALRSESLGTYVTKGGGTYRADAADVAGAEPFRMQATDLGRYLLYGPGKDFLANAGTTATSPAVQPGNHANWTVSQAAGAFTVTNEAVGRQLAVGTGGVVVAVPAGSAGEQGLFGFAASSGCARYPEVEVNAVGRPAKGNTSYGEVSGMVEGHMHGMAFEFLGGRAHCGRPWHRFGAPSALVDCPDHELANGCAAVLENVLYGNPVRCHDPVGWPTFKDWPHPQSLTHEQSYYKWLERAWRGGLRLYVNLMVENRVLCEVYPFKQNNCNEMQSVLLQIQRIKEMQDYIDAQSGGPGKGFFRIVENPFQARRVINGGKLAVVMGMEVSEPFGCRLQNRLPACTTAQIDEWIDRLHGLGIRQLEIVNKFDNGLTGVAGDSGTTGTLINGANFLSTGQFWDLEHCDDEENHDHSPTGVELPHNDDLILANGLKALLPGGTLPVYGPPPHCNAMGLTPRGEHAIRKIIDSQMIFDPDHMSLLARNQALNVVEAEDYAGIVSSHSWSTPNAMPRIYRLGGIVTPYAGSSESFVHKWQHLKDAYRGRQYFGVGYGADMNGFGAQGNPRGANVPNPVTYPFESFDGTVTFDRQRSGERVFDINVDGVAHYGLYPDWVEDLRMLAGNEIIDDMGRGAEAYLQMWERAEGIPPVSCGGWREQALTPDGLGRRLRLGDGPKRALTSAGQPVRRTRTWRWCSGNPGDATTGAQAATPPTKVAAGFAKPRKLGLIASTLRSHRAAGIAPGAPADKLKGRADPLGNGVWVRPAGGNRRFIYGVRNGKVSFTGVTTRSVASAPSLLLRHLRSAGVR